MPFANTAFQVSSYLIFILVFGDRSYIASAGLLLAILLPQASDADIIGVTISCCLLTALLILIRPNLLVFLSWNILLFKNPAGCGDFQV